MQIQIEERAKKELFTQDEVALLEINIRYPTFSVVNTPQGKKPKVGRGIKTANAFLEDMAGRCFAYAREKLLPRAAAAYADDKSPRKKFTHRRYLYAIDFKVTFCAGAVVSLVLDVTLHRGGKRLCFKRIGLTFDLRSGRLCPLFLFADADKKTKRLLADKDAGFYLRGEGAVVFLNPAGTRKYREFPVPARQGAQNNRANENNFGFFPLQSKPHII